MSSSKILESKNLNSPFNSQDNIFQGVWCIIETQYYSENGWEVEEKFSENSYTWEFLPEDRSWFTNGSSLVYKGVLIEREDGYDNTKTTYYFRPMESLLVIDRSVRYSDGFLDECIEENFEIELIENESYKGISLYLSITNNLEIPPPYFRYRVSRL